MPNLTIYTNEVAGGWLPEHIHHSLGGGEESLVLFALAMTNAGKTVEIYSSINEKQIFHGITFYPRQSFDFSKKYETLITWKDYTPWRLNVQADKKIHWSSDVEMPWSNGVINRIDHYICFSTYHLNRNSWVNYGKDDKGKVIQLGVDYASVSSWKEKRQEKSILYCSSPDRGLETLLDCWRQIQEHGDYKLIITYGFKFLSNDFINNIANKTKQKGITLLGAIDKISFEKLLSSCEYWCLPLNNKDSELFCLNAIKSRITGTTAIINDVEGSGLTDTIDRYVPFHDFIEGNSTIMKNDNCNTVPLSWDEVVKRHWLELV